MAGFKDVLGGVGSGGIYDKLPLEHMANSDKMRFFNELVYRMRVKENPNVPIAGVSLNGDKGIDLNINTPVLGKLPIDEQKFVMAHECGHVLLEHFLRLRRPESIQAWNIATDLIINETLKRSYADEVSPLHEDGKEVTINYDDLVAKKWIVPAEVNKPFDEWTSEDVFDQLLKHAPKTGGKSGKGQGQGQGQGDGKPGKSGGTGDDLEEMDGKRFDKHDQSVTKENMDQELADAIDNMVRAAKQDAYGKETGNFVRQLEKACKKHYPFERILDKIIYKTKMNFDRPHRRIVLPPFFFPRRHEEKMKVYAAVDVSGSCFDYTEDFLGYILALPEFEAVYFFDDGIKSIVKKGEECPKQMQGYGGTDLNPVLEEFAKIEKSAKGYKVNFVVLTDGFIPPIHVGPVFSNTIIMTTNDEVHWAGHNRGFRNIKIEIDKK